MPVSNTEKELILHYIKIRVGWARPLIVKVLLTEILEQGGKYDKPGFR